MQMQQQQLPERLRGHGVSLTDYRAALMATGSQLSRFTDLRTSQKLRVTRMVLDAMHVCIPFATLFTEEELAGKVQDIRSHVHAKLDAMEARLSDDASEEEVKDGLNTLLNAPCNGFTGSRSTYDFVCPGAKLDANDVYCANTLGFHVTYQLRQRYRLVLELAAEELASAEPDAIKSLSSLFRADLVKHHMQKSGTDEDVEEAFDSAMEWQ